MAGQTTVEPMLRRDYLLLGVLCLLLFGYSSIGGRPLTMHEAVLPQSAREMLADGDWIVPKSGGRPWLERPPLPQWMTVAVASVVGRCDREWIVRLAPAAMGALVVLIVSWIAAGWFGRTIGLLSGCALATMFEFVSYAWLAEEDIFLCAVVTSALGMFVYLEFFRNVSSADESKSFFGPRPVPVLGFFILLGATNLVKGLLFGTAMASIPIAAYLIWIADWGRIRRYIWCWGWLLFAAVSLAWPLAAYLRYPDVLELWEFDHFGRLNGNYSAITEPVWYYLTTLPWEIAPWTPVALVGLALVVPMTRARENRAARFLICWALMPLLVFSIPSGKHHHYLLQCLAPWGILAAVGLCWLWPHLLKWVSHAKRPVTISAAATVCLGWCLLWLFRASVASPAWLLPAWAFGLPAMAALLAWSLHRHNGRLATATVLASILACYFWIYSFVLPVRDQCWQDTAFLKRADSVAGEKLPLMANADLNSMDVFRILFYLDGDTTTLHELDQLLDDRMRHREVYIVTKLRDKSRLDQLGRCDVVLQSEQSRRESSAGDRLTLFHLRFADNLVRRPYDDRISPMRAMGR